MARLDEIISIVNQRKKVEVNELAELLNVSKVTIRKDLDRLEKRGMIHRQHGFAEINNQDDLNYRLATNYDLKKKIATKARELVNDGETIIIESGSTCVLLAEEIAMHCKDVTIITNSCFLAAYVRKYENIEIILLGGEYQKDSQVNVGPLIKTVVDYFYVDKLFVGIDGYNPKGIFTGSDLARADASKLMAQSADKVIILTDSSKFVQRGLVTEFNISEVDTIFTDIGIEPQLCKQLEQQGVNIITV
ncbi:MULTISPECIES: DeoR/GlpR family DNA-binding transcription regulator [unclassified Enterococcus]|uniref:DeoR/GlpR family DNA-binding transcription regulator n=1 Tax=unclassified Enterococcus TaxID=2608891 RepID=UPI001557CF32|nr:MULTISPECIES: DeoR/GlpR family DNA-binding transcription regulator [unclassified Enterococcus]MBS7577815.1 DeoR/GlpR transcriptional regulator [Enterococcus sp. MMGLQ5-2]MBS7585075.1 DeoR/GlpR transcriptional regulator [Enterococcus sp. MMGLQ5-1]NPD12931.1 DeoR/GlpR transcriptional regulator [Enterococcus sp. MMGLQ5-1]NPD37645.1 DeoR/GlpR transcriptional regulator [Enterococcus sp. MMGLQ5-2]